MRKTFKELFDNSFVVSMFTGEDRLYDSWLKSFSYKIIYLLFNTPLKVARSLYIRHNDLFRQSLFFSVIEYLSSKLHFIIGVLLIVKIIIPDHLWYNIYGILIILIVFILFIYKIIVHEDIEFEFKDVDFSISLFFLSVIIAGLTSVYFEDSINYLLYYLISYISLTIIVNVTDSYSKLDTMIKMLLIGIFLTALYGFYQWLIVGIEVNPSLTDITLNQGMGGRVYSTMGNPNVYGELLVLTIPFFGAIILNEKNIYNRIFWSVLLVPIMIILLKTGSRSAWIAFVAGVLTFVFFWNKKLLPFVFAIGLISIPFLPDSIYSRIMTVFNQNDTSLKYRQMILKPALVMLRDYWITGVGLGNKVFLTIYQRYKSFGLSTVAHTHNLYIQIWLEAGIFAMIFFAMTLLRMIKFAFLSIRKENNRLLSNIMIASVSSMVGICVMGLADHVWFYNRILFMFWVCIAFGLASFKLIREEKLLGNL